MGRWSSLLLPLPLESGIGPDGKKRVFHLQRPRVRNIASRSNDQLSYSDISQPFPMAVD